MHVLVTKIKFGRKKTVQNSALFWKRKVVQTSIKQNRLWY